MSANGGALDILNLGANELKTFLLALSRIASLFTVTPIFSSVNIPGQVKAGVALMVTLILLPTVSPQKLPDDLWSYGILVGKEMFMGFILGSMVYMTFVGIQVAGQLID